MAPNPLLKTFAPLLLAKDLEGPVLDLACGEEENGLFLAGLGLPVILADRSPEALAKAKKAAEGKGLHFFEGLLENPQRAMAQIVCRKPF